VTAFLAPEQVRGDTAGPPADLWSLGTVLFLAVEGETPFGGAGRGPLRRGGRPPWREGRPPPRPSSANGPARPSSPVPSPRPSPPS
jgi:serine/threonine protein kinase